MKNLTNKIKKYFENRRIDKIKENSKNRRIETNEIEIKKSNGPSSYCWDDPEDYKEIKSGNPIIKSISSYHEGDIAIVTKVIDGTFKSGYYNEEFDLVLRYKPNHFSWGGCYNHYFLNEKLIGITKTDKKTMYSMELEKVNRNVGFFEYLREGHIKKFKPLIKELESDLGKKILDEKKLEEIFY